MSRRSVATLLLCLAAVLTLGVGAAPAVASGGANPAARAAVSALPTPTLTITFGGLTGGFLTPASAKLGHTVRIYGTVTPASVGGSVAIRVQKRVARHWVTRVTATCAVSATGAYSWKFTPARRGKFRAAASISTTASSSPVTTGFQKFRGYGWFNIY